ncbi:hypothetical protein [Chryseobacterium aquaticum]|uniref:hypothetical protein n=1 Tax=Chryseobacterium aquaticum TaxID=452084 RepID=UPI003F722815
MSNRVLYLLILFFTISCTSQKSEIEYIEFEHECGMLKVSDKIFIRILPSSKKQRKERIVELTYHGKMFMRKPIPEGEYQKLIDAILQIKKEESENIESLIIFNDSGSNEIIYRKGSMMKKNFSFVLDKKYNSEFYNAAKLITKAAELNIEDIR